VVPRGRKNSRRPDHATDVRIREKHSMVIVVPIFEEEMTGVYYNRRRVINADGQYMGQVPQEPPAQVAGFWEKFFFKPGNLGYPVFQTRIASSASTSATTGIPGRLARARAERRRVRSESVRNGGRPEPVLWEIEQPAAAVANGYYVGADQSVRHEMPWEHRQILRIELFRQSARQDHRAGERRQG